jgi:small subunit ribosomal protein S7
MLIFTNFKSKKQHSSTGYFYNYSDKKKVTRDKQHHHKTFFHQARVACNEGVSNSGVSNSGAIRNSTVSLQTQKYQSTEMILVEKTPVQVKSLDFESYIQPSAAKQPVSGKTFCDNEGIFNTVWTLDTTRKQYLKKIINLCMKDGKKTKSFKIISNTLRRLCFSEATSSCGSRNAAYQPNVLKEGAKPTPFGLILLINAVENVKPIIEVKKVRISGATQLVPSIIPKNRQVCLAFRWIIEAAISRRNAKKNLPLEQCFFAELIDASKNVGTVRKRRDDLHKLAESNRGFAHYRWWDR